MATTAATPTVPPLSYLTAENDGIVTLEEVSELTFVMKLLSQKRTIVRPKL